MVSQKESPLQQLHRLRCWLDVELESLLCYFQKYFCGPTVWFGEIQFLLCIIYHMAQEVKVHVLRMGDTKQRKEKQESGW